MACRKVLSKMLVTDLKGIFIFIYLGKSQPIVSISKSKNVQIGSNNRMTVVDRDDCGTDETEGIIKMFEFFVTC